MGRKKGTGAKPNVFVPDEPPHAPQAEQAVLVIPEIPKLIEYIYGPERWRCSKFDELVAEFENGLCPEKMPLFHEAMAARQGRGWLIVRRLYGIMPVFGSMKAEADPDDLRSWSRADLRQAMGMESAFLKEELDGMRGHWSKLSRPDAPEVVRPMEAPRTELALSADEDLRRKHYIKVTFVDRDEEALFMERVRDYEKALEDRAGSAVARSVLTCELQIYRLEALLNDNSQCPVGSGTWKNTLKLKQELEAGYKSSLQQLQSICPWIAGIAGKFSFAGVMSEVTRAIQEYQANGDNRLADGIFTATEIQVECRRSVQATDPRYRGGLVVFLNAAKAGLWDPRWQSPFTPAMLKKVDAAWKAALVAVSQEAGDEVPDLEKDGPEGEYEALVLPSQVVKDLMNVQAQPKG